MAPSIRLAGTMLLAFAPLALEGCNGCRSLDAPVSSPPAETTAAHRTFPQSETSMVRIDQGKDRPRGEPISRFIVAYNDSTDAVVDAGSACWSFNPDRPTLDGWARSDDFGSTWQRQPQLPVGWLLPFLGIHARHGDPWLASWKNPNPKVPGIVLYVSVGQANLARFGSPFFLLLARSRDAGKTFGTIKILGPQNAVPDGPKVAITGDGKIAMVVWNEPGSGIPNKFLWELDQASMSMSNVGIIDPVAIADPPQAGCTFQSATAHPRVAAGRSTFYVGARVSYRCNTTLVQRLEVYRNTALGLALGSPWRRIVSAAAPISLASGSVGILNVQDITMTPQFGTRTDRGSSLPTLAVGQGPDGEFVVLADVQVQGGTLPDELQREKVILYRLANAEGCNAASHRGDLDSCGQSLVGQDLDALCTGTSMDAVANRAGVWESKPALFTGKVPDGTMDERVGVVWYTQPYKGRMSVTDEMRARTVVEAAVSMDGGKTFEGPFLLTGPSQGDDRTPIQEDPDIGPFFHPCQILCSGYYGEYISGLFQFAEPGLKTILATWGDSREGCTDQTPKTTHHHVWSGAVRAR